METIHNLRPKSIVSILTLLSARSLAIFSASTCFFSSNRLFCCALAVAAAVAAAVEVDDVEGAGIEADADTLVLFPSLDVPAPPAAVVVVLAPEVDAAEDCAPTWWKDAVPPPLAELSGWQMKYDLMLFTPPAPRDPESAM